MRCPCMKTAEDSGGDVDESGGVAVLHLASFRTAITTLHVIARCLAKLLGLELGTPLPSHCYLVPPDF